MTPIHFDKIKSPTIKEEKRKVYKIINKSQLVTVLVDTLNLKLRKKLGLNFFQKINKI